MSGKDNKVTTQEYTEINKPACDSVIPKFAAMSESSPMGINSDVLKIKADTVIPINGSHAFKGIFCLVICMKPSSLMIILAFPFQYYSTAFVGCQF